jgi:hypothetical protein
MGIGSLLLQKSCREFKIGDDVRKIISAIYIYHQVLEWSPETSKISFCADKTAI